MAGGATMTDNRNPSWQLSPLSRGQPQRLVRPRHLAPVPRPDFLVDTTADDKRALRRFLLRAVVGLVAAAVIGAVLCEVTR